VGSEDPADFGVVCCREQDQAKNRVHDPTEQLLAVDQSANPRRSFLIELEVFLCRSSTSLGWKRRSPNPYRSPIV
jgi:hypothetical protein